VSPENGEWEQKNQRFRFIAEHWRMDVILLDGDSQKTTNVTAVGGFRGKPVQVVCSAGWHSRLT
jgi:hypothetical protein